MTELIKKSEFSMEKEPWESISSEAKDLISCLIVKDPEQRLSPEDALSHQWFFETTDMPAHRVVRGDYFRARSLSLSSAT